MANYLIYPFKVMNITQTPKGKTSHLLHGYTSSGKVLSGARDFCIDEAGKDSGKDSLYCPCDSMKVVKITGKGNGYTNTVILESTTEVNFADGSVGYALLFIQHPNDSSLSGMKVGKIYKRKQRITDEGNDGTSANHIHMSVGKGHMKGSGQIRNANGKWVADIKGTPMYPTSAFYIDRSFTTVKRSNGMNFKALNAPIDTNTIGGNEMTRGYFKIGDANEGVYSYKQMLMALKKAGIIQAEVDNNNVFGSGTERATRQVQKAAKLTQDGFAGKKTLRACFVLLSRKL